MKSVLLVTGVLLLSVGCKNYVVGAKASMPLPVEGMEGCTVQAVYTALANEPTGIADGYDTSHPVVVVRCPVSTTASSQEVTEGKTTVQRQGAVVEGDPTRAPGCVILPEVLTQGASHLYTVKCPTR
jgi:hypothetical protein